MNQEQRAIIKKRLEYLAAENGGRLTPENVVKDAKKKSSPLHNLDCWNGWNEKVAAEAHWISSARALIRDVRVVITEEKRIVKSVAYVRDPTMGPKEQGYVAVDALKKERDLARDAVQRELKYAKAAINRAIEVADALGLADEVAELLGYVDALQVRFEAAA